ncbi:hypothetical protein [Desulfolutivibrio sulfoxidireducens]|uniref:hypothetical protein n=1 Tax=Desulfolutivibrio sulfoxidireducens TaxID=2773299 RepID=UPI00159D92E2|nr:hypothetical protein [Desulfolutivibrio sulfoxidireducens]QLA15772.1 hypothetical protein GD605_06240 [Desulfolutivibrio sulfoxidireducens]QLA19377.1 hypothetical protein GD604_06265 [Desulfolutivibrio sulfoxidireducens]
MNHTPDAPLNTDPDSARPSRRDPMETLAHHVAGHVVMSFAVGCPALEARIDGPFEDPGYALPGGGRKLTIRRRLLVALAGHRAEARFLGEAYGLFVDEATERLAFDMLHVMREFEEMGLYGTGASAALRGQLGHLLSELLARPDVWDAVSVVARELLARGRLDAPELRALVPEAIAALGQRLLDESRPAATG